MKKINHKVLWVFAAVCMEITALGMIIPLSPYMARSFGADDLQVGLLMSIYSIIQMICSPFLGRWSDFLGRRPILLISMLCTGLSYVWFALAPSLTHLFLSRAFAGLAGVTVSTSFALVSDLTDKKNRSKSMAWIGAAFGVGFVIGPILGGFIGYSSEGLSLVALGAALMCFIGLFIVGLKVKESSNRVPVRKKTFSFQLFKNPSLVKTLLIFFVLSLSLTLVEAPLFLLMKDRFQWPQSFSSWGFAYIGFILALTQGGFVRYLIPRLGEKIIIRWGFFALSSGLFLVTLPYLSSVAIAVTLLSLGFGLAYTCLTGVISLLSQKDQQGGVLGVHQSISSFSRIVGPALGGWCYRDFGMKTPFIIAGTLSFIGLVASFLFKKYQSQNTPITQNEEHLEISFFQLNNLIKQQVPFSFINLSKNPPVKDEQNLLSSAKNMTEEELAHQTFQNPVVLICEDGKLSKNLAIKLSGKIDNVFYCVGGWNHQADS